MTHGGQLRTQQGQKRTMEWSKEIVFEVNIKYVIKIIFLSIFLQCRCLTLTYRLSRTRPVRMYMFQKTSCTDGMSFFSPSPAPSATHASRWLRLQTLRCCGMKNQAASLLTSTAVSLITHNSLAGIEQFVLVIVLLFVSVMADYKFVCL